MYTFNLFHGGSFVGVFTSKNFPARYEAIPLHPGRDEIVLVGKVEEVEGVINVYGFSPKPLLGCRRIK